MSFTAWAVNSAPPPILPHTSEVNWPSLLFGLAWLGLLVAGVAAVVVIWLRRTEASRLTWNAEAMLAERFAAGELEEADFQRRRSVLRS